MIIKGTIKENKLMKVLRRCLSDFWKIEPIVFMDKLGLSDVEFRICQRIEGRRHKSHFVTTGRHEIEDTMYKSDKLLQNILLKIRLRKCEGTFLYIKIYTNGKHFKILMSNKVDFIFFFFLGLHLQHWKVPG